MGSVRATNFIEGCIAHKINLRYLCIWYPVAESAFLVGSSVVDNIAVLDYTNHALIACTLSVTTHYEINQVYTFLINSFLPFGDCAKCHDKTP